MWISIVFIHSLNLFELKTLGLFLLLWFLQPTTALLRWKRMKGALLVHMLLNSGGLLSFPSHPSAPTPLSLVRSLIAGRAPLPEGSAFAFPLQNKTLQQHVATLISTQLGLRCPGSDCVWRRVLKVRINTTRPNIWSVFGQNAGRVSLRITLAAPDWVSYRIHEQTCSSEPENCEAVMVTPTHFCCLNIPLTVPFPVITTKCTNKFWVTVG